MTSLSIATFNVEWAKPSSARFLNIQSRLLDETPDVVCLTEGYADSVEGFEAASSDADYGYRIEAGRRKVALYSRAELSAVETQPVASMPGGRFVSADIQFAGEALTVIGVCIPWAAAHVSTGRKDRTRWEDHLSYLDALDEMLPEKPKRTVVVGDFNQAIPRRTAPKEVFQALERVLLSRFDVPTRGLEFDGKAAIDHVAISTDLIACDTVAISNVIEGGKLSDHFGAATHISLRATAQSAPHNPDDGQP